MKRITLVVCFVLAAFSSLSSVLAVSNLDPTEHYVTIFDGDKKTTVKIDADTVKEVLNRTSTEYTTSDLIEPDLSTPIDTDSFFINIYHARPVEVIDGIHRLRVMTAAYDPRAIANEAGFEVYDGDEVNLIIQPNFLEIGSAETYEITRNGGSTLTVKEEIPFGQTTINDYNMSLGMTEVVQLGEVGEKTIVYNVKTINGQEVSRTVISDTVTRQPVSRVVRVGTAVTAQNPLTPSKGRNRYTATKPDGTRVERQETYYDLPMDKVMHFCGKSSYFVRADGVKVDNEGYVIIAANLNRYPRCSIVETSLGLGRVYDTGGFAQSNPEQFDIATDWTNRNGR